MDAQTAAEEVRAHLVVLRGGAPFLSAVDGRLLMEWLEAGVPVSAILMCLEQEADKRRKKRRRTPLKLSSIRSAVKKAAVAVGTDGLETAEGLQPYVDLLRASSSGVERDAAETLSTLSGDGEALVDAVLQHVRALHERRWAGCDREQYIAQATEELAGLRDAMKERAFEQAVEEVARDLLRQQTPLLSATVIWDTVIG